MNKINPTLIKMMVLSFVSFIAFNYSILTFDSLSTINFYANLLSYILLIFILGQFLFGKFLIALIVNIGIGITYLSYYYKITTLSLHDLVDAIAHIPSLIEYYFSIRLITIYIIINISLFFILKNKYKIHFKKNILLLILIIILYKIGSNYYPNFIFNNINYIYGFFRTEKFNKNDLSKEFNFSRDPKMSPINIIFVRADSLRSDLFGLNNPSVNNTPKLSAIKNIISYPNVYSFRNQTDDSLGFMFTRYRSNSIKSTFTEKSFISIFRNLGFKTTYISINDQFIGTDKSNPARTIIPEAEFIFNESNIKANKVNPYNIIFGTNLGQDRHGIDGLTHVKYLDLFNSGFINNNSLTVISHCCGGHVAWDFYPWDDPRYNKFKPFCKAKEGGLFSHCTETEIKNAYNNSVSYIDDITEKLIKSAENTNSIIFFSADHGEFLGEYGKYGHGHSVKPFDQDKIQLNVPTFIYVSESFKSKFPEKYKALLENKNKTFNHSFLFDSILGCSGVDSIVINQSRNICSTKFQDSFYHLYPEDKTN